MPAAKTVPNGTAEAPIEVSSLPPLVGINFGNSFASIAVFVKDGVAECIANEDGERQIACAISFSGEEIYIGNQATQQLVKNSKNTITGFRNLLGKKFSEIPQSQSSKSAPVIQHPDLPDTPAYKVQTLQPAPTPLPRSTQPSNVNTPLASQLATPRSEPIPVDRILTVSEVTTMFIASLVKSAEDYLGRKVEGAVITVPSFFDAPQKEALEKAATDAGVHVLQLIDEAGAAAVTTTSDLWQGAGDVNLHPDRTQLIIDVGSSSLSLSLLSIRSGLAFVLSSSTTPGIGGDQIDDKLIKFFAADFTKKTKSPLSVCPSTDIQDQRAEAKLRLAIEHTKRTISASPGAATCSVESLKDGMDYTGSINRMRFDLVVRDVYNAIATSVADLLTSANVDPHFVDELVYVGGSACLPGLDEQVSIGCGFKEDIDTPFARGTVVGGGVGDPTTVLARGCAIQGAIIAGIPDDELGRGLKAAYEHAGSDRNQVRATTRSLGVLVPGGEGVEVEDKELGGVWVAVVHKETALPARRTVQFEVGLDEGEKKVAFEVWEVEEAIRIEKVTPPKVEGDEEEEDEEPEEEEVKHLVVKKLNYLGLLAAEAKLGIQIKGKTADAGKWVTTVQVTFVVDPDGAVKASFKEVGGEGATAEISVAA